MTIAVTPLAPALGALDRKPLYSGDVVDTTTSDYVLVISNVRVGGKPIGDLGDAEAVWHMDMTYNEVPPMAAALYALAESEQLLDRLWDHSTRRELTWHHRWREGDLVLWDNRCVMHRRDAFDPAARRVMHRTQVKGDRPVFLRSEALR